MVVAGFLVGPLALPAFLPLSNLSYKCIEGELGGIRCLIGIFTECDFLKYYLLHKEASLMKQLC